MYGYQQTEWNEVNAHLHPWQVSRVDLIPILMGIICIRRLAPTIKILELNLKINQSHYEESNNYKQDEHQELSPKGD